LDEIESLVEHGKSKDVEAAVNQALQAGEAPVDILNKALIAAMTEIGEKFQKNEVFVPEMLVAARAMKKGVAILKPLLVGMDNVSLGKCIIGTTQGDLHDIGKNLVGLMLEGAGFEVIDLGVDVSAAKFIEGIEEHPDVKIVGLSALLTTTMPSMQNSVRSLKEYAKEHNMGYKVIVGGAPITQEFADNIGADGYSQDAGSAAKLAKSLVA
jgi:methanogenic corrinoid protein MtbC1